MLTSPVFRLQSEILRLEFERKAPDEFGRIREVDLAELLLTYADYSPKKRVLVIRRIRKMFKVKMFSCSNILWC